MKSVLSAITIACCIFMNCSGGKKIEGKKIIQQSLIPHFKPDTIPVSIQPKISPPKDNSEKIFGSWLVKTVRRIPAGEIEPVAGTIFILNADFTFSGKGRCNGFSGKYTLSGNHIRVTDFMATQLDCGENHFQEKAVFSLLINTVTVFSFLENKMLLKDASNNIVFVCEKRSI